jgi:hypothetical protein
VSSASAAPGRIPTIPQPLASLRHLDLSYNALGFRQVVQAGSVGNSGGVDGDDGGDSVAVRGTAPSQTRNVLGNAVLPASTTAAGAAADLCDGPLPLWIFTGTPLEGDWGNQWEPPAR